MSTFHSSLYNISAYSRFNLSASASDIHVFLKEYRERIKTQLAREEDGGKTPFISFAEKRLSVTDINWLQDNHDRFFKETANENLVRLDFLSECGFITCMVYSPEGDYIIVGHSTGLIQMRHGVTGTLLSTLRNIQFPPKPVYAITYSRTEERVCYAACMDGAVYRVEIPIMGTNSEEVPSHCITADPALEGLNMQFYGSPGISSNSTPFVTQRSAALSLGLPAEHKKLIVGYSDSSIRVYDMETQEAEVTYKVHKLRIQFIPKKLQRVHCGQVCALRCHQDRPYLFASGAWDKTLRIWDWRCKVGCVMTFEGVDICSDSIDLNRDQCVVGSWQPTEALTVWDLAARKRLNVIRVQNRRPDVDGEYIYACRYWRSSQFNRKGKYAIIGGSGTNCVEVLNLHNRYITCSYPVPGIVLAVTSYEERIAYGGSASIFTIVKFHEPKHERDKYKAEVEPDYDYAHAVTIFQDDEIESIVSSEGAESERNMMSVTSGISSGSVKDKISGKISESVLDKIPDKVSGRVSDNTSEKILGSSVISDKDADSVSDNISEKGSSNILEEASGLMGESSEKQ